ncbi:hypothetical protein PT974_00284 [Cladobotryum mycophilum]|uniref:Uncharacterized protein n=1 Tax=Cladobotryum mycophilum TaxID=491253 RepID=A0ABR0T0H7_9HYPO
MPSLRICFPTGDRAGDHQEYQIKFRDTLMWRQAMGLPPRPVYRMHRQEAVVPRDGVRADSMSNRRFSVKRMSKAWTRFSRRYETVGPPPPQVASSHYHQHHLKTAVHVEGDDGGVQNVEENRKLALDILEGKRRPVPNREYSGSLKHVFQSMYDKEKVTARVTAMRRRMSKFLALGGSSSSYSSSSQVKSRGWALLRNILVSELSPEDKNALPAYRFGQKAMLLFVEQTGEKMRVRHRRNLDACAPGELDAMLESIEARDWRDVIWITSSVDDMPMKLVARREVKVLEWGGDMI